MIGVVISGASGRMGKLLVKGICAEKDMKLKGALEKAGHPSIGHDAGEIAGIGKVDVPVGSDLAKVKGDWDVLIEFATPEATLSHLPIAASKGKGVIIGTTGFSDGERQKVRSFSSKIPVLLSPNMSVGVSLLFRIAGEVAKSLGKEYDVEIVETHHRLKKDSPSGTAMRLAESIAKARGQDLKKVALYGRQGITGERKEGTIGIHAIRGGTVTGDHAVIFAGPSERIELSHRAENREVFVCGALRAVRFMAKAKPALYDMHDVI